MSLQPPRVFCPLLRDVLRTSVEKWKGVSLEAGAELGGDKDDGPTPAGLCNLFEALSGDGDLAGGASAPGAGQGLVERLLGLTADEDLGGALGCGDGDESEEDEAKGDEEEAAAEAAYEAATAARAPRRLRPRRQ